MVGFAFGGPAPVLVHAVSIAELAIRAHTTNRRSQLLSLRQILTIGPARRHRHRAISQPGSRGTHWSPDLVYLRFTAAQATRWAVRSRSVGPRSAYSIQALLKAPR